MQNFYRSQHWKRARGTGEQTLSLQSLELLPSTECDFFLFQFFGNACWCSGLPSGSAGREHSRWGLGYQMRCLQGKFMTFCTTLECDFMEKKLKGTERTIKWQLSLALQRSENRRGYTNFANLFITNMLPLLIIIHKQTHHILFDRCQTTTQYQV